MGNPNFKDELKYNLIDVKTGILFSSTWFGPAKTILVSNEKRQLFDVIDNKLLVSKNKSWGLVDKSLAFDVMK